MGRAFQGVRVRLHMCMCDIGILKYPLHYAHMPAMIRSMHAV